MGPIFVKLYIILLTCDKFQQRLYGRFQAFTTLSDLPLTKMALEIITLSFSLPEEKISKKKNLIRSQTG